MKRPRPAPELGEEEFGSCLRRYREARGRSRYELAFEAGVDRSYLTRIEWGERAAPTEGIVKALSGALRLPAHDRDLFYIAAGYAPPSLRHLNPNVTVVYLVAEVEDSKRLGPEEVERFQEIVRLVASQFLHSTSGWMDNHGTLGNGRQHLDRGPGESALPRFPCPKDQAVSDLRS